MNEQAEMKIKAYELLIVSLYTIVNTQYFINQNPIPYISA